MVKSKLCISTAFFIMYKHDWYIGYIELGKTASSLIQQTAVSTCGVSTFALENSQSTPYKSEGPKNCLLGKNHLILKTGLGPWSWLSYNFS